MLKYKFFSIKDEDGINGFLEKYGDSLARDGISFQSDGVSILYSDTNEEDRDKRVIVSSIKQGIQDMKLKIAATETDLRWWKGQSLKGVKEAPNKIVDLQNQKDQQMEQLYYSLGVIDEINKNNLYKR